jgi:hypothetical protein
MPTEGKESFNPVGKHPQLPILCGNCAQTLRKLKKQSKIILFGSTAKSRESSPLFAARGTIEV